MKMMEDIKKQQLETESKNDRIFKEMREKDEAEREALRKEHGLDVQDRERFEVALESINNEIKDYEYKSFNKEYSLKDLRIYEISKKEYNADKEIKKLTEIVVESQKYLKEVVPENENYHESIRKYRHRIIADLYIKGINQIKQNKYDNHLNVLSTKAKEIDQERIRAMPLVAHIDDPTARQAELDRLIDNPYDIEERLQPTVKESQETTFEPSVTVGTGVRVFTSTADMIGRLMLLITWKGAGNVVAEIDNEAVDILDHLRSKELLTSDEYEILHRNIIAGDIIM